VRWIDEVLEIALDGKLSALSADGASGAAAEVKSDDASDGDALRHH